MSKNVIKVEPKVIECKTEKGKLEIINGRIKEFMGFINGFSVESGHGDGNCTLGSMLCFVDKEDLQAVINKVFERNWDYVCTDFDGKFEIKKRKDLSQQDIEEGSYQTILERVLSKCKHADRNLIPICFFRTLLAIVSLDKIFNNNMIIGKQDEIILKGYMSNSSISYEQDDFYNIFEEIDREKIMFSYTKEKGGEEAFELMTSQNTYKVDKKYFCFAKGDLVYDYTNCIKTIISDYLRRQEYIGDESKTVCSKIGQSRYVFTDQVPDEAVSKFILNMAQSLNQSNVASLFNGAGHTTVFCNKEEFESKKRKENYVNGICKDMTNWDEVVKCLSDKNKKQRCIYVLNLFRDNQISKEMLLKIVELDNKQYDRVKNFVDTMRNNRCPDKLISRVVEGVFKEPDLYEKHIEAKKKGWNKFLIESIKKENISEVKQELNNLYEMSNKNDECFDIVLQYYMGLNGQARRQLINLAGEYKKENKGIVSAVREFADFMIGLGSGKTFQKIVGQNKVDYFDKDLTDLLEFVVSKDNLSADDKNKLVREIMKIKFLSSYLGHNWDNNEFKEMITKATSNKTEFGYLITMLDVEITRLKELTKQKNANDITNDSNNSVENTNVNVFNADQRINNKNINPPSKFGVSKFVSVVLTCVFVAVAVAIFALANILTLGFVSLALAIASASVGGYFFFKELKDDESKVANFSLNKIVRNMSKDVVEQNVRSVDEMVQDVTLRAEQLNSGVAVGEQTQSSDITVQGYGI